MDQKSNSFQIIEADFSMSESWDKFVHAHPNARLAHSYNWKPVIEKAFGHRCIYLAAMQSDKVLGVLPLTYMNSILFGSFLISVPYLNYGGILAYSEKVAQALLKKAIILAKKFRTEFIEFRHLDVLELQLKNKAHKVTLFLELPDTAETLWKKVGPKVRNQIRKAQKLGLVSKMGRQDLLDDFYDIFAKNMKRLGTPVYPKRFFRFILDYFDSAQIFTVYSENQPLAAGFTIAFRGQMEIPWASSIKKFNPTNANMLLYWSILEFSCQNGIKIFDFGRCSPGSGTYRFKKQWGGVTVPLNWQYWLSDEKDLPDISPNNKRYETVIRIWKTLPLPVTKWMGPLVIRYIP